MTPEKEAELLDRIGKAEGVHDATLFAPLAELTRSLGSDYRHVEAVLHGRRLLDLLLVAKPPQPARVAEATMLLGDSLRALKRYDEAGPMLLKAVELAQKEGGKRDPRFIAALLTLASMQQTIGKMEEADAAYIRAIEVLQDLNGAEPLLMNRALVGRESLLRATGRADEVGAMKERAATIRVRDGGGWKTVPKNKAPGGGAPPSSPLSMPTLVPGTMMASTARPTSAELPHVSGVAAGDEGAKEAPKAVAPAPPMPPSSKGTSRRAADRAPKKGCMGVILIVASAGAWFFR